MADGSALLQATKACLWNGLRSYNWYSKHLRNGSQKTHENSKHIHRPELLFCYNGDMDYGKIVKQLREKMLLSQEEMAKKLGVSFATVNRQENGRHEPTFKERRKLRDLCKKYHVDFE